MSASKGMRFLWALLVFRALSCVNFDAEAACAKPPLPGKNLQSPKKPGNSGTDPVSKLNRGLRFDDLFLLLLPCPPPQSDGHAMVPRLPSARKAAQATEAVTDIRDTPFAVSRSTPQARYSRYTLITANIVKICQRFSNNRFAFCMFLQISRSQHSHFGYGILIID